MRDPGGPVLTNGAVALTGPIDVAIALNLLAQRRNGDTASTRRRGSTLKVVTAEQTERSILRKLKAMSERKARPA